jgi:hypothetical protein
VARWISVFLFHGPVPPKSALTLGRGKRHRRLNI